MVGARQVHVERGGHWRSRIFASQQVSEMEAPVSEGRAGHDQAYVRELQVLACTFCIVCVDGVKPPEYLEMNRLANTDAGRTCCPMEEYRRHS